MPSLSQNSQRILRYLMGQLPKIVPGSPETYVGYRKIHQALDLEMLGDTWGVSLKNQGLLELAQWTKDLGAPAITGIVVTQDSYTPGDGFFVMYGNPADPFQWWADEVAKAKAYDWESLLAAHKD